MKKTELSNAAILPGETPERKFDEPQTHMFMDIKTYKDIT